MAGRALSRGICSGVHCQPSVCFHEHFIGVLSSGGPRPLQIQSVHPALHKETLPPQLRTNQGLRKSSLAQKRFKSFESTSVHLQMK